jgi:hypothetical protein
LPAAVMPVTLDLRKAHKHQRIGDLIVVLTWVNDERALVLLPALRKNAGWYIVQESAAFKWGIDHSAPEIRRDAMAHANEQAYIACAMLNLEPSKMNRTRVISVITSWIPDLVVMPSAPDPEFKPGSFGQLILSADGKPIAGEDMRQEVEGVVYAPN